MGASTRRLTDGQIAGRVTAVLRWSEGVLDQAAEIERVPDTSRPGTWADAMRRLNAPHFLFIAGDHLRVALTRVKPTGLPVLTPELADKFRLGRDAYEHWFDNELKSTGGAPVGARLRLQARFPGADPSTLNFSRRGGTTLGNFLALNEVRLEVGPIAQAAAQAYLSIAERIRAVETTE